MYRVMSNIDVKRRVECGVFSNFELMILLKVFPNWSFPSRVILNRTRLLWRNFKTHFPCSLLAPGFCKVLIFQGMFLPYFRENKGTLNIYRAPTSRPGAGQTFMEAFWPNIGSAMSFSCTCNKNLQHHNCGLERWVVEGLCSLYYLASNNSASSLIKIRRGMTFIHEGKVRFSNIMKHWPAQRWPAQRVRQSSIKLTKWIRFRVEMETYHLAEIFPRNTLMQEMIDHLFQS